MKATITILALLGALVAVAASADDTRAFDMRDMVLDTCVSETDGCVPPPAIEREPYIQCFAPGKFGWTVVPCEDGEIEILPHGAPGAQGSLMEGPDGKGVIILE